MSLLEMKNVSKGFGRGSDRAQVLCDVNLTVQSGEFVAIVGYSGAGKTTLISLLAGLLKPDTGNVLMHGQPVTGPGPQRGIVFQNYSLLPWMTVMDNVKLAVNEVFRQFSAREIDIHCLRYIEMVNLTHATNQFPGELSGGMRQRVSLARALAMRPEVLLMDEPLSALDALTRGSLQEELARICESERTTMVLISNDVDEAILLADRIIPLTAGPNATLGESFHVKIDRPRTHRAMEHCSETSRIRMQVLQYLIGSKQSRTQQTGGVV